MKKKYLKPIVIIIIIFLGANIVTVQAEKKPDVSIVSTKAEYLESKNLPNNVKYESYDIVFSLENNDDFDAKNVTVRIIDEENIPLNRLVDINSTEIKTVTFEEIWLPGVKTHSVKVQIKDSQNNTLDSQTIYFNKKGLTDPDDDISETPGFEILLLMISIISILIITKRKRK